MVRQKMFYTGCSSRLHDLEDFIYEIDKKLTFDLCFVNWNITHTCGWRERIRTRDSKIYYCWKSIHDT